MITVDVKQHYPQTDSATAHGDRMCMSSTVAMHVKFLKPDALKGVNADDDHLRRVLKYGDTTNPQAQLAAIREYGLEGRFSNKSSLEELIAILKSGRPVSTAWLHYGPPSAPRGGGHWSLLTGLSNTMSRHNDPYGEANMVHGGYARIGNFGKDIQYSLKNWLPRFTHGGEAWIIDIWDPATKAPAPEPKEEAAPPSTPPAPKSNFALIAEDLLAFPFPPNVVAGIIGNFMRETGRDLAPDRNEGGQRGWPRRRGGYGLAQWTGVRQLDLIEWCNKQKLDVRTIDAQLRFFRHEITNTWERRVVPALLKTKSPEQAAVVFEDLYERAGVPALAERKAFAREAYERIRTFYG